MFVDINNQFIQITDSDLNQFDPMPEPNQSSFYIPLITNTPDLLNISSKCFYIVYHVRELFFL